MSFSRDDERSDPLKAETTLVTAGRDTKAQKGFVNPPVVHGSTVLYPTADDLHAHRGEFQYGRHGTPTTKALQEALMALEGPQCAGVGLVPSGVSAISTALLSEYLREGDRDARTAALVYSFVMLAMSLAFASLYTHVARRPALLADGVDPAAVRRSIVRFSAIGILLYLATMVVALVSAPLCLVAHFVIALYYCFQQIRPTTSTG